MWKCQSCCQIRQSFSLWWLIRWHIKQICNQYDMDWKSIYGLGHSHIHICKELHCSTLWWRNFFVLEVKNEFTPWLSFSALFPHKLRSPEHKKVLDQSNTRKQNLFCTWSQLVRFAYIELVSPTHLLLEVRRGTCLGSPTHPLYFVRYHKG